MGPAWFLNVVALLLQWCRAEATDFWEWLDEEVDDPIF